MIAFAVLALLLQTDSASPQDTTYRLLAGAESDDNVALIEFTPCRRAKTPPACGARVARTYDVGLVSSDIEGPHGVVPTPDGKAFYVSIAHGRPYGFLQKYDLESGRLLGQVELGMFPASVDAAPGGSLVYAINFNFEDPDMAPSSLSIVDGATMTEVARPTTCRMPHGSRLNPQGTKHYSGCMMDDLLIEIDTRTFAVSRAFSLVPGKERPSAIPSPTRLTHHADSGAMKHEAHEFGPSSSSCSPTWAQSSADGTRVYVACNRSNDIVEIDASTWRMLRRWSTPPGPYNLAVTPDGKLLVATQKGPGTTSVWRLSDAKLLVDIRGTRKIASGVAVSPDSRYAFVTLEGIGGEPGTLDIIDLAKLEKVASVDMGKQAGGVAVVTGR